MYAHTQRTLFHGVPPINITVPVQVMQEPVDGFLGSGGRVVNAKRRSDLCQSGWRKSEVLREGRGKDKRKDMVKLSQRVHRFAGSA